MHLLLPLLLAAAADSMPVLVGEPVEAAAASYVVHRQPAIPLVALRLSLLADDPAGYAGTGHLVQHLHLPVLRDRAARVGATVEMQRTSDAVAYVVTGPAAELEYLAEILQDALRPPRLTQAAVLSAQRALAEERLAEWETADQHVRSALRARLFPNDLSAAGTEESATRLTPEALPGLWARMYRPERLSIVAVGDVRLPEVEAAFRGLPTAGAARGVPEREDTISLVPLAAAQATQAWLGQGYLGNDLDPAALSVAARMLRDHLRPRIAGGSVEAEHWWTHYGQGLALVVSAPERSMTAARRALSTVVSTLQSEVDEREVREAARAIRREMLFYARTPDRMADVLGRFTDREGDPDAAQRFYARLDAVDPDAVRDVLAQLLTRTAVRVEIPAQKIAPRR